MNTPLLAQFCRHYPALHARVAGVVVCSTSTTANQIAVLYELKRIRARNSIIRSRNQPEIGGQTEFQNDMR